MKAEIGIRNGMPVLEIDGVQESGMCMMPGIRATADECRFSAKDFAEAGVKTFADILWPYLDLGGNCYGWWTGPRQYDFSRIEERFQSFIKACPQARLIIRIKLNVPQWWLDQYPGECSRIVRADTIEARAAAATYLRTYGKMPDEYSMQPSLCSLRWRQDSAEMLGNLVDFFENSPVFSKHVIGYLPAGGESSEWFWWGYYNGMIDYSEHCCSSFAGWQLQHFGDVIHKDIPGVELRNHSEDGFFRDPLEARAVVDYRRFLSDVTADTIIEMGKVVKIHSNSTKLTGAFYGYGAALDGGVMQRLDNLGFQGLKKILASPEIDFLCAPTSYMARRGGSSGHFISAYTASLNLHWKLYWDEADMRTHLFGGEAFYKTITEKETLEVNWRSYANSLIYGNNLWWFLLCDNKSFHDPKIMGDIKRMVELEKETLRQSKKSVAEIAVFCDEESMFYFNSQLPQLLLSEEQQQEVLHSDDPIALDKLGSPFTADMLDILPRIGAPSDFYLLDDICHPQMSEYKLYIFLNAFYLNIWTRQAITEKLQRENATALWVYAPGYLTDLQGNTGNMTELTGINFIKHSENKQFGEYTLNPYFEVSDPEVKPLGSAVWKERQGIRHIYSPVPPSLELLRQCAEFAGVHCYIEPGDVFNINQSFIMLHSQDAGSKTIRLKQPATVLDLRRNSPVCENRIEFTLDAGKHETILLQYD